MSRLVKLGAIAGLITLGFAALVGYAVLTDTKHHGGPLVTPTAMQE